MFSASTALLAFFVGIVGCIFGGTQTFIVTGFVGLFIYALQAVGIQSEFLSETLMSTCFTATRASMSFTMFNAITDSFLLPPILPKSPPPRNGEVQRITPVRLRFAEVNARTACVWSFGYRGGTRKGGEILLPSPGRDLRLVPQVTRCRTK